MRMAIVSSLLISREAQPFIQADWRGCSGCLRIASAASGSTPTLGRTVPTVLAHPAVPLALAALVGTSRVSGPLLVAGVVASVLPDADVLAFRVGVAYTSQFGHRGFTHSLAFAFLLAAMAWSYASALRASRSLAFWYVGLSCASHGLLDMLTNGGHGVAYLWPFTGERFFFPAQVIEASTLNLRRFFGPAGLAVLTSELLWVWVPAMFIGVVGVVAHRKRAA